MKNYKRVFSIKEILIFSGVLLFIASILSWCTEKFDILPIKNNLETMLYTLWSIQASVSTLTIAILALLITLNKEKRFGINILDFMLSSNRKIFTFQDEVLIILLLILFQYFFVAFLWLSGSIFIFITGLLIIVRILYVSIKIILFDEYVQEDIKNYIIDALKKELDRENEEVRGNFSEKDNK